MPPKKVEKKEIAPIFDFNITKFWWEYKEFNETEIQ